jgi:hypothetical protein
MANNCVNINSPAFKKLVSQVSMPPAILMAKISLWQDLNGVENFPTASEVSSFNTSTMKPSIETLESKQVDYIMKSVDVLLSSKGMQMFAKGQKNNWDINKILTELQIPNDQKQIILNKKLTNREEIITSLLADNSFVVEVNTAMTKTIPTKNYNDPDNYDDFYETPPEERVTTLENEQPTQVYSNLTVPGGTNYTENEISTPDITPNIKGHAQFSTDNGIGWFRSDDKANSPKDPISEMSDEELQDLANEAQMSVKELIAAAKYRPNATTDSKTRRILEVQSDLFQKGRDSKNLTGIISKTKESSTFGEFTEESFLTEDGEFSSKVESIFYPDENQYEEGLVFYKNGNKISQVEFYKNLDVYSKTKDINKENNFLQLLNKKGNWVNFFIQSIVKDSAKKGYEKVLFPKGDTAAKIRRTSNFRRI